jgi:hypothetical protein
MYQLLPTITNYYGERAISAETRVREARTTKKRVFIDGFFLDGFRNRLENKICRRFFLKPSVKFFIMDGFY